MMAMALQPLSSQLYFLKGRIYNQQENYESAIENLRMANRMNPLNAAVCAKPGVCSFCPKRETRQ